MRIRLNHPGDAEWIASAAGGRASAHDSQCLATYDDSGESVGGVLFDNYTGASLCMHMAGKRASWANKTFLWAVFYYPFVQLGCRKVFGMVPASKPEVAKFDMRLGFRPETVLSDALPDGDLLVLSMYKSDCRWLAIRPDQATLEVLNHGR